jgi:hypothetical protein
MIVFENKFSVIISQCQQSTIATASLWLPLDCCDRSKPKYLGIWNATVDSFTSRLQSVAVWQSSLQVAR